MSVKQTTKADEKKSALLVWGIDREDRERFKKRCWANGTTIQRVIGEFIKKYK